MKFWTLEILGFLWALPVTVLGVLLLLVSGGWTFFRHTKGLRIWIKPRSLWWMPKRFRAMCLGSLVIYRAPPFDNRTMLHEDEHRRQCWIFGPFILILYPILSLLALAYKKPYRANWFEIMARSRAGQETEP